MSFLRVRAFLVFAAGIVTLCAFVPSLASAQVYNNCQYNNTNYYYGNTQNYNCGQGTLDVYVQVVNETGGVTYSPSNVTVTVNGQNPSPASFPGSQSGTLVALGTGAYSVSALSANGAYELAPSYSTGCTGTMNNGATPLCVITVSGSATNYNPYPTPYPYPYTNQQLTCAPAYQTVTAGQAATFTAEGGAGVYNWSTADRTFLGVGPTLTTILQTTGSQTVIVANNSQTATCTVNVVSNGGPILYNPTIPPIVSTYIPSSLPNTGFAPQDGATLAFAFVALAGAVIFLSPYVRKTVIATFR